MDVLRNLKVWCIVRIFRFLSWEEDSSSAPLRNIGDDAVSSAAFPLMGLLIKTIGPHRPKHGCDLMKAESSHKS